jgi:truncated hemoglobin YjbI
MMESEVRIKSWQIISGVAVFAFWMFQYDQENSISVRDAQTQQNITALEDRLDVQQIKLDDLSNSMEEIKQEITEGLSAIRETKGQYWLESEHNRYADQKQKYDDQRFDQLLKQMEAAHQKQVEIDRMQNEILTELQNIHQRD